MPAHDTVDGWIGRRRQAKKRRAAAYLYPSRALASCMPTYVYAFRTVRRTPRIIRSCRSKVKPLVVL